MEEVTNNWDTIAPVLKQLRALREFTLGVPCVVVGNGCGVTHTVLSDLSRTLRASSALSSGVMTRYLELASTVGAEQAWDELANGDSGEEFCGAWDQTQEDIQRGCRMSMDEVVEAVMTARRGFESTPRQLLVVVVREKWTEITLVS